MADDSTFERIRWRWPEGAALGFYAALVAFAIPYHEPWADEAQAWQLARSLSLGSLFKTYIRYEGSPGLWHFLLWILIRAHVTYAGMHWICGAIAAGATALLIFKSPFPRYLRLLLPFTYFLLFQYAVVARSYVLVPILLYSIALCWKRSPLILALLLGLLANVALHAAVISGGLAVVYLIEQSRDGGAREPRRRRQFLLGALILVALWAFALWTAWPPPDLSFRTFSGSFRDALLERMLELFRPGWLGILFWMAMAVWFRARSALLYMLPILLCGLFCLAGYASMWHVGLLYPLLFCMMWITWPAAGRRDSRRESVESIGRTALVLMAIVQILWSAYAIQFDHYRAYSPDLAAAEYLRPLVEQGNKIAVTSVSDPGCDACRVVGILPYFDHHIFINLPEPFWWWSDQNPAREGFDRALATRPAVVVVEVRMADPNGRVNLLDPSVQLLSRNGYRFTNMFCGFRPAGLGLEEKSCHLIFQRSARPQDAAVDQKGAGSVAK